MLYIQIIIIAVVIAYIFAKWQEKVSRSPAPASASAEPSQEVRRVLTLDGTTAFQGSVGFVKSFGIPPSDVSDLRYFSAANASLDSLPERVRECLARSYQGGFARGLEVPAMLDGSRALAADEALYFALVQRPKVPPLVLTRALY
jgi:hypothetical protein